MAVLIVLIDCKAHGSLMILVLSILFCYNTKVEAHEIPVVTILADDSYPPYSYVENNELKGIYVDIVRAAAKLFNKNYQVKLAGAPWKRALMEVKKGRVFGILPPYKHIAERDYIWPYSLAIMSETVVAYCHNDINIIEYFSSASKQVLPILNIGINSGYMIFSEEIKLAIADKKMLVWENKSTNANILKLQSQRIDCYLNDRLSIQYELLRLNKTPELNFDDISESLIVMTQSAHIGYSDSANDDFPFKSDFIQRMDSALTQIKATKQYDKIIAKYLSQ